MCFTVNVNIVKEELESRYGSNLLDPEKYSPSYYYHAFAYPELPVAYNNEGSMQISLFNWGLIPGWINDVDKAKRIRSMTHNARSETIDEKPSFAESFRNRRCLVPVAGFFEWQHIGSAKRPWYIYSKESAIISLAGIYDRWYNEIESRDIYTFSILTTRANSKMSEIHNSKRRMPVIVPVEKEEEWLRGDPDKIKALFVPLDDALLSYHTVNPSLGKQSASKNRSGIIEPYLYPEEPTLF
jgi:putative SOS response-associated peptidase YedK